MPSPERPVGSDRPYCSSATYRKDPVTYEFPIGDSLSIIQTTHNDDYENIRGYQEVKTVGEIRLRRLPTGSKYGKRKGNTTVEINVSHPNIEVRWTLEEGSRFLKVTTPRFAKLDTPGPHCVSLGIVA